MTICTVTLIANAGICLQFGEKRIWIDALHNQKIDGFSTVTPVLWKQVVQDRSLMPPDIICFTHCHSDHYSRELTHQARALWPQAKLILPEKEFPDQILLSGNDTTYILNDIRLQFFRIPHSGTDCSDLPHYGVLITRGDVQILIPGDCEVENPRLTQILQSTNINLALLNFTWLARKSVRTYIQDIIHPDHLLIYHLPFAEDERHRYRAIAQRCAKELILPDVRLLTEPLQREILEYE